LASVDAVSTIHPFNHPRIAISDFACAVKIVQYSLQKITRLN
jgi:rod shape-determining protein MreB